MARAGRSRAAATQARLDRTDRDAMIAAVVAQTAATATVTGRATLNPRVLAALSRVRREAFVPAADAGLAYVNTSLPIGHGQTILQPFLVALMTELLDLSSNDVVLEIGTGSGYHTAILAALAHKVFSVEVFPDLVRRARHILAREGCRNVAIRCGDGALGWPEHAPYDAILVGAAVDRVPPALLAQLRAGGRMVIPIADGDHAQRLVLINKDALGAVRQYPMLPVTLVPLVETAADAG